MAGDKSFDKYNFGVVASDTVDAEQINSFLDGEEEEVKPITKQGKNKAPTPPLKEDETEEEEISEGKKPKLPDNGPLDFFSIPKENEKGEEIEEEEEENDGSQEEEEGDNTSSTNKPPTKKEPQGTVFEALSQELYNLGIFTPDEDEEDGETPTFPSTPEDFAERWMYEKKKGMGEMFDRWLKAQTPEEQEHFHKVHIEKVPPKVYLQSLVKIQDIANLDLTDEYNQERIVEELYRQNGKKDPKAAVQKVKEYGDLESEAIEAKEILTQREQEAVNAEAKRVQEQKIKDEERKKHYHQSVHRILSDKLVKKEFDGIPVNKQFAESIAGYITQDKYQTPQGEFLTEFANDIRLLDKPENYELKVKMAMLMKMVKEDPTLSKIKKTAVSQETNKLFNKVAEHVSRNAEKTSPPKPKTQYGW